MLGPVREAVGRLAPAADADARAVNEHFLDLTSKLGETLGYEGGRDALERLGPEIGNLEAAYHRAITGLARDVAFTASRGFAKLMQYSGLGSPHVFRDAKETARSLKRPADEANCIKSLGNIALVRSDHEAARSRYEQALPLYRQVGSVFGEANCIQGLGDIAKEVGDVGGSVECWLEALELYQRIPEPYSIGRTYQRLARTTTGAERVSHVQAARKAWLSIDRPDLFKALDDEFGAG